MKPSFRAGRNIAMKVPSHEFAKTVHFYEAILGWSRKATPAPDPIETVVFDFGGHTLWIDRIDGLSQAEIWIEIVTADVAAARAYLEAQGCHIRDEIETLPPSLDGFWLSSPANIIHLVAATQT
jgi:predicted enzyme related to lactoylglutathione lyase